MSRAPPTTGNIAPEAAARMDIDRQLEASLDVADCRSPGYHSTR